MTGCQIKNRRRGFRRVVALMWLTAIMLIISGCGTVRTTNSEAFRTGRVLEPGRISVQSRSVLLLFAPAPGQIGMSAGLPGGLQVDLGYGIHGIADSGQADESDDTVAGLELGMEKEILTVADRIYVSASASMDLNLTPQVDWLVVGGINGGLYATPRAVLFGNVKLAYLSEADDLYPLAGLGIGVEGLVTLKAAIYRVIRDADWTESSDILWPFYYGIEVGFRPGR